MLENKKEGIKYILFIGIPVIIILSVLGAYYYATNPMTILSKTINSLYSYVDKIDYPEKEKIDNEKPIVLNANIELDSNINELKDIQKYNYNIGIGLNTKKEYMEINLGMKEKEKEILTSSIYQIQNKQYIKSDQIFDKLIEVNEDAPWDNLFDLKNGEKITNTLDINNMKEILKELKDIFLESLDKKYISREKKDISINDKNIKTTKITYLLNQENQEYTKKFMVNKIKKNKKLLENLEKFLNTTEEEIIKSLDEWNETDSTEDYSIELYTEGLNQNVVKAAILENNKTEQIIFTNYNSKTNLNLNNEILLTFEDLTKEKINIKYELIKEKVKGSLEIETKEKNHQYHQYSIKTTFLANDINLEIKLELEIANKELITPNTSNAVSLKELTGEEMQTILENLENALKGTFLYDILDKNIM